MITPRFSVSQDDEFIIVTLHVKYIKARTHIQLGRALLLPRYLPRIL
jgi:hypothetical protein